MSDPAKGLSAEAEVDEQAWTDLEVRHRELGVRRLPARFAHMLAIVSDVDATTDARFSKYIETLTRVHGLDFGDSAFLLNAVHRPQHTSGDRIGTALGQAFLGPTGGERVGKEERYDAGTVWNGFLSSTRRMIDAYHQGDIDHLHTFFPTGPRVQKLVSEVTGSVARFTTPSEAPEGAGAKFTDPLLRASERRHIVIDNSGNFFSSVAVYASLDEPIECAMRFEAGNGTGVQKFTLVQRAQIGIEALFPMKKFINILDIGHIEVETQSKEIAESISLYLVHASTEVIRGLSEAVALYGIRSPLITGHSGFHFRTRQKAEILDGRLRSLLSRRDPERARLGIVGSWSAPDGARIDTDADGPESVSRAVPEATNLLGQRFVIPCGFVCILGNHLEPRQVLRPSAYQTAHKTMVAARVNPVWDMKDAFARRSIANNFSRKLEQVLENLDGSEGKVAPIYTHLGLINPPRMAEEMLGEGNAYFGDETPLEALRQRHFGQPQGAETTGRVCVFRASVVYGYILALMNIAEAASRTGDAIFVRRILDAKSERPWPESAADLFGLTFGVEDPEAARIELEGAADVRFVANQGDAERATSITVINSNHRFILDEVDFAPDAEPSDAASSVCRETREDGRPEGVRRYRRFRSKRPFEPVRWVGDVGQFGMRAAQTITFEMRSSDPAATIEVLIETERGLRLALGSGEFARTHDCHCYLEPTIHPVGGATERGEGAWQSVNFALWDCRWLRPAEIPPNDPPIRLCIHATAARDATVDLSEFSYGRPRIASAAEENGLVLAGVLRAGAGEVVLTDEKDGALFRQEVDYQGHFCFRGLRPGHYSVAATGCSGKRHLALRHHRAGLRI